MLTTANYIQLVIALGILNVWILRFGKPSPWRGGNAVTMAEEFAVYGLSTTVMYAIGFIKVLLALLLIAGIWVQPLTVPVALVLAAIMVGSVAMHFRVGDPLKKSVPAALVLLLCLAVVALA
jgi:hypothetical protein